jgi:hypothetical protein
MEKGNDLPDEEQIELDKSENVKSMFEDPEWLEEEVRAIKHWRNNAELQKLVEEEDTVGI